MTNARTAIHWLGDIIRWGEKLDRHITGLSREQFLDDEKTQDAASKCAEAIGEAADQLMALDPTYDSRHPELQLKNAYKSRNRLSHGYYSVDIESLWLTVSRSIPSTVAAARKVLAEHDGGDGAGGGASGGPS